MNLLYVHQNFPAQFGHIASHLVNHLKWNCTYVSETPAGVAGGVRKIQYKLAGGATLQNHFCSRTFENTVWHCDGVYQAMKQLKDFRPDLIVGHSGFGSTLFLRELYPDVPCLNLFEFFYKPHGSDSDMDFRQDLGWELEDQQYLRARCRNAMMLLDLQNCDAAYAPTNFQRSRFPVEYLPKIEVVFDGVDRNVYNSMNGTLRPPVGKREPRTICGVSIPTDARIVTYVSRGFESMRGFDIFIQTANRIARENPDAIFMIVGTDRIAYGGDASYIAPAKTFKEWTLTKYPLADPPRFFFLGKVRPLELAKLLASSDLHIYLTVPFVLSWSMVDAMSCGAVVLGSATPPVMEMIKDGENGLLADFFDVDGLAIKAISVLKDPGKFRPLGDAAEKLIDEKFSLTAVLPRMIDLYTRTANATGSQEKISI